MTWDPALQGRGVIAVSCVLAAMAYLQLGGLSPGMVIGSSDAPRCDDAAVARNVVHIFNQHPQYVGRTGKAMTRLVDAREVDFRRHPEVGGSANTRWCRAQGRFAGSETETVDDDLFSTRTTLGPAYGTRACFGRFHPVHKHCSFARPPRR
jgi:hypothetical protein